MVDFRVLAGGNTKTRKKRTPNFPQAGVMKPFGLYPVFAHPVLPGETMNSFTQKWRVVSKPVKHPLVGCWLEYWLVYVKFTDLDRELGNMFISDNYSTAGWTAASDSERYFTKTGQIDWIKLGTERVHDAYFIHDGETPRTIDGVRQVKLNWQSWCQNMMFEPTDSALPSSDVTDAEAALRADRMALMMGMTEITYEKYLQQFGVQSVRAGIGEPEILRYARSWVLPVNTVEPTTGYPSSAWVWSDTVDASKPKRFDEPGFVLGLACVRPKMFQKHLQYSAVGNLWGFSDWFPAYNLEDPSAGIRTISTTDAVFHADHRTDAGDKTLVYDHRDLLAHGEQFVNEWDPPFGLPLSTGLKAQDASTDEDVRGEYCLQADIDGYFVSATASDKFCYYEGMAQLDISGHIVDYTQQPRS